MKNTTSVFAFVANVNGQNKMINAFNINNAVIRFRQLDSNITIDNVVLISQVWNKEPIEKIYPLLFTTVKESVLISNL